MMRSIANQFCRLLLKMTVLAMLVSGVSVFAAPKPIDAKMRRTIVDEIAKDLNDNYIFLETAQKMERQIRTRLKDGAYDKLNTPQAFSSAVNDDLQSVSKDKHLGFRYDPENAPHFAQYNSRDQEEVRKAKADRLVLEKRDNFGFRKVERLDGNVGYLVFDYFASPETAGDVASYAMNFLSNCDALIIDLRQNGGGDPSQIQLISSYLFDVPVHLNDLYSRRDDRTENYWTLPYVPGNKMPSADIYVLTSDSTFSGAEEFAYNLKSLKRATLIGETTLGGAHPTTSIVVAGEYVLHVPFARAINPITKTNWEGIGVTPDVAVSANEAYNVAYRMALEKLMAKASAKDQKNALEWALTGLKSSSTPVSISDATMQIYAGTYQNWKIILEKGSLFYHGDRRLYRLTPMSMNLFSTEETTNVWMEFIVKDDKAVELIVLNRSGERTSFKRTN